MRALLTFCLLALLFPPAWAETDPCAKWTHLGYRPGMELIEAGKLHDFVERQDFRGADHGYRRYYWRNNPSFESVELHADVSGSPRVVIGIAFGMPEATYTDFFGKWGPPTENVNKANHTIHTWWDRECDVTASIHVIREKPNEILTLGLTSISLRDKLGQRKRAAAEAGSQAEEAEAQAGEKAGGD